MNCCEARHHNRSEHPERRGSRGKICKGTNETSYCLVVSASTEIIDEGEEVGDEGADPDCEEGRGNTDEQEQEPVHYARAGGGWIGLLRCQVRRGIFSKTV